MNAIFVSQSFIQADRDLVEGIDRLLTNFGFVTRTGLNLGGEALTCEVMKRIDRSDALIALVTRRDQLADGGWMSSSWVRDEYARAKDGRKPAIALIENGVRLDGAYLNHAYEHIKYDRNSPLEAFLRVSDALREWRDRYGRVVRVRLQPEEAAALASGDGRCSYRTSNSLADEEADWQDGKVMWEPGGVFLVVRGLRERDLLQVRIESQQTVWRSPFEPQLVHANLKNTGAAQ
jgi:hypothetical protein